YRFLQHRVPLREATLERIRRAQASHEVSQPVAVVVGTTEGQALLQYPDGVLQVSLVEVQEAEGEVRHDWCARSASHCSEAERLLPVALARGEGPKRAQGLHQPRLRPDTHVCTVRTRCPLRNLDAPPQELSRPVIVADSPVCFPQAQ